LLLSGCTTLEGCLSLLEELVEADGLVASVLASILAVVLAVVNVAGVLGSLAFAGGVDEGSVLSGGTLSFSFAGVDEGGVLSGSAFTLAFAVVLSLASLASLALLSLSFAFAFASFSSAIGSSAKGDIGGGASRG
jgi:hypothetical protein